MVRWWNKSANGTWHVVGRTLNGKELPECQSYNLDRPNYLGVTATGEVVPSVQKVNGFTAETKVCKRCAAFAKSEKRSKWFPKNKVNTDLLP